MTNDELRALEVVNPDDVATQHCRVPVADLARLLRDSDWRMREPLERAAVLLEEDRKARLVEAKEMDALHIQRQAESWAAERVAGRRERIATAALEGLLFDANCTTDRQGTALAAIEYADALIAALDAVKP